MHEYRGAAGVEDENVYYNVRECSQLEPFVCVTDYMNGDQHDARL